MINILSHRNIQATKSLLNNTKHDDFFFKSTYHKQNCWEVVYNKPDRWAEGEEEEQQMSRRVWSVMKTKGDSGGVWANTQSFFGDDLQMANEPSLLLGPGDRLNLHLFIEDCSPQIPFLLMRTVSLGIIGLWGSIDTQTGWITVFSVPNSSQAVEEVLFSCASHQCRWAPARDSAASLDARCRSSSSHVQGKTEGKLTYRHFYVFVKHSLISSLALFCFYLFRLILK